MCTPKSHPGVHLSDARVYTRQPVFAAQPCDFLVYFKPSWRLDKAMGQKSYLKVDMNGEVCITGNRAGLLWLARMCIALTRNPEEGHIHLQNEGDTLDSNHLPCTLCFCGASNHNRLGRQRAFHMIAVMAFLFALCAFHP